MALTVETGTVVPGANSYASIATADEYHLDRLNTAWGSATTAQKAAALLNATTYLDGKYRSRWKGLRVSTLQPLEWPRAVPQSDPYGYSGINVVYETQSNIIPIEIVQATCELALRALSGPLAADISAKDRVKRKKVDVLETEYVATDFATVYQVVDQLVGRFLNSGNDAVRG